MNVHSEEWKNLLASLCRSVNLDSDGQQSELIANYVSEVMDANKKINFTAITDAEEVAEKHIVDSLIPAKLIPEQSSVIDLGTGGGFPGIPLKIHMPSLRVTLVDSSRKKVNFLKYVTRILTLENISAHQFRVEALSSHPEFAGQFDVAISRAFTSLKRFLALAAPLIKPDGIIIAMKGKEVQTELDELEAVKTGVNIYQINGREIELHVEKYRLPVSGDERSLVMARNNFGALSPGIDISICL